MMTPLQFRIAARTDAAGKYSPTAPLEGNEDNMFVDNDLSNEQQGAFTVDEVVNLSDKGCLMVVADGMGGMNAGEVASDIAIKTVMAYFSHHKLTDEVTKDTQSRIKYMEEVVVAADDAIKADANSNKEHEGMGSTIILAWLCDGEICLTWCGDSRAYLYRPTVGLRQVSKDHSYVQGLVDEGKINEIEAFDHPYGNIVTRSLGDPEKKAKPDSYNFKVYKGDIFMLCSDGLNGVVRDKKTFVDGQRIDMENLEDIISQNLSSMGQCRDALFDAAERNDWYDNVTVILCEITEGAIQSDNAQLADVLLNQKTNHGSCKRKIIAIIAALVLLVLACVFGFNRIKSYHLQEKPSEPVAELIEDQRSTDEESAEIENNSELVQQVETGINNQKVVKLDTLDVFILEEASFKSFTQRDYVSTTRAGFQLCSIFNDVYEEIPDSIRMLDPTPKTYYLLWTKNQATLESFNNAIRGESISIRDEKGKSVPVKNLDLKDSLKKLNNSTRYFIIKEKQAK